MRPRHFAEEIPAGEAVAEGFQLASMRPRHFAEAIQPVKDLARSWAVSLQ